MDGSLEAAFSHKRPFWSTEEVAALLPEDPWAVARWCARRQIPGAKKGPNGRWLIPAVWVRKLLSSESPHDVLLPDTEPATDNWSIRCFVGSGGNPECI